jgi:hypothetical protein
MPPGHEAEGSCLIRAGRALAAFLRAERAPARSTRRGTTVEAVARRLHHRSSWWIRSRVAHPRSSAGRGIAAKLPKENTMKRSTLLLTCAFMLAIAGAVGAQMVATEPAPEPTTALAPAARTALAPSNPEIPVSGKVVSSTSTELVIDSDAGEHLTFALDPTTTPATTFAAGERVTVRYHTPSVGALHQAVSVTLEPLAEAAPVAEDEPMMELPPLAEAELPADVEPQAEVEPTADVEPMADAEPMSLPETASNRPLIGLLGFLAMVGAVAVRVARS